MNAARAHVPLDVDVVSVQSQVVYGRVGNNVAIPTFERHGLRTASVPTVLLSNTPHYPSMHGGAVPDDWFAGWLDDLVARGALERLRAVQTGYLGSPGQARILGRWMAGLRTRLPGLQVCIDPVIGDRDVGIYVDPRLADAYRDGLLELADGITPNAFELGQLTGIDTDTADGLATAARSLLRGRTQWVVATSALPAQWREGRMLVALVTAHGFELIEHERLDAQPKGTGDLFSATLTSCLLGGQTLRESIDGAVANVVETMHRTRAANSAELLLQGACATTEPGAHSHSIVAGGLPEMS